MDYAKAQNMDKWLRHPAMGDPSFDTFEKVGGTVHKSEYPYEWAVNGSLFVDADGAWYLYAGLYIYGYQGREGCFSHFETYRSRDEGKTWENLGPGLDQHYMFEGVSTPSSGCPDAVLFYDKIKKKYMLTYDWGTENNSWAIAHSLAGTTADSGAAVAYADTPAGPFTRIPQTVFRNSQLQGHYGRFDRFYATTVIPREKDYLALILCDTGPNFAWGLAAATARSPEEGFSAPVMVLNADLPTYYPAPMEYYPAFVVGDTVYAPATSVAANRNYQFLFAAKLEEAHRPEAWSMVQDGSLWHSRPLTDEKYGIWGQTFNGMVDSQGNFRVMYASKDERGYGALSVATRKWDEPVSDGFTFSGHAAPSVTLLRDAYRAFTLEADFSLSGGAADFLFDFSGKVGANMPVSDCAPCPESLTRYAALRVSNDAWALVNRDKLVAYGRVSAPISSVLVQRGESGVSAWANGEKLFDLPLPAEDFAPVGIRVDKFTVLDVTRFQLTGDARPAVLRYNDADALLGGGVGDIQFKVADGLRVGSARVKWNAMLSRFTLVGHKGPDYGKALVRVDGQEVGVADFHADAEMEGDIFVSPSVPLGRHGVELIPRSGKIAVPDMIAYQD